MGKKLNGMDETRHCASEETAHCAVFFINFSIQDLLCCFLE